MDAPGIADLLPAVAEVLRAARPPWTADSSLVRIDPFWLETPERRMLLWSVVAKLTAR